MPVVWVQVIVLAEQFQPSVESVSVMLVAVSPGGNVMPRVMGKAVVALIAVAPFTTPTVMVSALSPS